ncbi:MATE family efflux transporter [Sporomusa acidovorans]|uniref:Probable multidrug resistance protein NorM n=1 Tax=Sporomusa acidovorans (strain ATCC 49682 / DSM 3132 / Mol) TaxID=1123286 RepID=A0ABZ3JA93_SPOA4|nr:MATE family efflux transporter [Sporomusa acidovorans]OZC22933.1 multidrug resistance protein MdtK [Sporomusa acidovorans DSM 3132]SDE94830.1 putative efflux protein, MATE family [Sporomusa acidovorans]
MIVSIKAYMRRQIIKLAWPVIFEGVAVMAVNALVTAMVGRLGAVPLAAVGLATMMQFSAAMVFAAAGTGAAAIVARETGAGNWREVRNIVGQAIMLGAMLGIVLAVVGWFLAAPALGLTAAEPAVTELAAGLVRVTLLFTPWFLVMSIGNAALRGMGKTETAFYITFFSNSSAILISYILIFGHGLPAMGPYGAAWGLGLSQMAGALAVLAVLNRLKNIRLAWRHILVIRNKVIERIVEISAPAALEQLAMQSGRMAFAFMLAGVGALQFAAHQIAIQIESMSFMPGFGFSVASMTLVGQYLGKGMPHRAVQFARLTNRIACLGMSVVGVVIFVLAKPLTGLFIADPHVIYWGTLCVMISVLEQPTLAVCFVLAGALRGAGDTRWPMYITTFGVWLIRLPLVYLFIRVWGYDVTAAWYITAGDYLIRSAMLWWRFNAKKWGK